MNNLPPGVRESDIPGNNPDAWDSLFNWLLETGLEPDEIKAAVGGEPGECEAVLKMFADPDNWRMNDSGLIFMGDCDNPAESAAWVLSILPGKKEKKST